MGTDSMDVKKDQGFRLSYKFRLYPTPEQERYFAVNFKCVRYVYNYFLDARMKAYQAYKEDPQNCRPMSLFDTTKALTALKKKALDRSGKAWLKQADSTALVYALRNLDNAYQNFFRRVKMGEGKPGFPKFKSRNASVQSFTVSNLKVLDEGFVVLAKVGAVKARIHREVKGTIVSGTISKNAAGQYYIAINVKEAGFDPLPENESAVGIAMGVGQWMVTSHGQVFDGPQVSKRMERKLARERRRLSRKQRGSANYQKQKQKLARTHQKIAAIREYETHSLTRQIVNENGIIVSQEMATRTLMAGAAEALSKKESRKVNRVLMDANFAEANRQLAYKSEWAGRSFVLVSAESAVQSGVFDDKDSTVASLGSARGERFDSAVSVLEAGLEMLNREEASFIEPVRKVQRKTKHADSEE